MENGDGERGKRRVNMSDRREGVECRWRWEKQEEETTGRMAGKGD